MSDFDNRHIMCNAVSGPLQGRDVETIDSILLYSLYSISIGL